MDTGLKLSNVAIDQYSSTIRGVADDEASGGGLQHSVHGAPGESGLAARKLEHAALFTDIQEQLAEMCCTAAAIVRAEH